MLKQERAPKQDEIKISPADKSGKVARAIVAVTKNLTCAKRKTYNNAIQFIHHPFLRMLNPLHLLSQERYRIALSS